MTQLTGGPVSTLLLFVLFLSAIAPDALAQSPSEPSWRFGIGGGGVLALHSASFGELPGIPQPAGASDFQAAATGARFAPHLFIETPSLFAHTSFGVQLDYQSLPALLQATEQFDIRSGSGQVITVTNAHEISASLQTAGVELFAHVPLVAALGMRVGVRGDVPVGDAFTQSQEITDPPDLEFVGYEGRVITASGGIPNRAAFLASLSVGLTYTINRESPWPLRVGGMYRLGLTNLVSSVDWKMSAAALTLSLVYAPAARKPVRIDTVFQRDTTVRLVAGLQQERTMLLSSLTEQTQRELAGATSITVQITEHYNREIPRPGALLTAGLDIRFMLDGGKVVEQVNSDVRTTEVTRYVFCSGSMLYNGEQTSNSFSGMFSRDFSEVQEQALGFSAYDMQRRVLRHLKAVWDSSGVQGKVAVTYREPHLREARAAADTLRRICAEAWGTASGDVPVTVELSQPRDRDNRMPEMGDLVSVAFLPHVTLPLITRDTIAESPVRQVLFRPSVVSEAGVRHWELQLLSDTVLLHIQSGEGTLPGELVWKPDADVITGRLAGRTIRCLLTVEDRDGQQTSVNGEVVFRNSGGKNGRVDRRSLRFVVEGPELPLVAGYIREQAQHRSLVPVQVHYWYAGPRSSSVQSVGEIARLLNLPEKRVQTHIHSQSFGLPGEAAYIDILDITAGVPQPER